MQGRTSIRCCVRWKSLNAGIKIGEVPMLNQELELSLNMAFARARKRHEFMTVEHLLLALLSNPSAREALEACSVDLVAPVRNSKPSLGTNHTRTARQ